MYGLLTLGACARVMVLGLSFVHSLINPRRMREGYGTWFVINPWRMREGYGTCFVINPQRMHKGYGTWFVVHSFVLSIELQRPSLTSETW